MNKTKTVEELIKVILEDFHFTKSLDDGPYGISEQWLEEKIQAVFTAAKEEGRREGLRPANPFDSEVLCSCRPKITNI